MPGWRHGDCCHRSCEGWQLERWLGRNPWILQALWQSRLGLAKLSRRGVFHRHICQALFRSSCLHTASSGTSRFPIMHSLALALALALAPQLGMGSHNKQTIRGSTTRMSVRSSRAPS